MKTQYSLFSKSSILQISRISFVSLVGILSLATLNGCDDMSSVANLVDLSITKTDLHINKTPPPKLAPSLNIFKGQKNVTYAELLAKMEKIALELETSTTLQAEFKDLQKSHKIADNEQMYKDFVRVRLAFEATRDSGLWRLRWAVTDQEPNSDRIWKQWKKYDEGTSVTAIAECDELSALFAVIARGLGVSEVGLFWPTYNHTVAVWKAKAEDGSEVRIIVPTSQSFLSREASLGTTEFDPYQQKTIYDYIRKDVKPDTTILTPLAEIMISQIKAYGDMPMDKLQSRRNQLARSVGGS